MTKRESEETPEQRAFSAAQAGIRACVLSPDKSTCWTWYRSGSVTVTVNGVAEQAGRAWNVAGFNALLEQHGVAGLSLPGEGKRPERLIEHG